MDLWSAVLDKISEKISKSSFKTWLLGTSAEIDDDVIIVKSKNEFVANWLEERYKPLIFETVREVAGQTYEIEFSRSDELLKKESVSYRKHSGNVYDELKSLIIEQREVIKKQQEKMEELEKRIQVLEQTN